MTDAGKVVYQKSFRNEANRQYVIRTYYNDGTFKEHAERDRDRIDNMFIESWEKQHDEKSGYRAIARQRGVALGCDTPFAFKCFEFKLFQSGRVSISKALSMGLAEAAAYRSTKDASLQSVRMLMDCYTPDHSMFKIEGLPGLYRIVSLKELQKSPPDECVFAIDVSLKRVMAYERIQDKIANAILDALEEAVDA